MLYLSLVLSHKITNFPLQALEEVSQMLWAPALEYFLQLCLKFVKVHAFSLIC